MRLPANATVGRSRRRSSLPIPLSVFIILLLVLLMLYGPDAARAQTAMTLVSNIAETSFSGVFVGNSSGTEYSQGFGTGSHPTGYLLTGVSVVIEESNFTGSETATFKIYDSDVDGTPKDEIYALTPPTLTTSTTALFTAPADARLEPNTKYHVVFQGTGDDFDDLSLILTSSDDQTGEHGWTIEDAYRFNETLAQSGSSIKMDIQGSALPIVSNQAENTVSGTSLIVGNRSGTETAQGFGTGRHNAGYLLTGVSVTIAVNSFTGSETATFKIYDSEADGTPKDELYTLITPTLTAGATVFFAAPESAKLQPETTYHVVFQGSGNSGHDLSLRLTDSDEQTGAAGWTIEDAYRFNESPTQSGDSVKIDVYGVENNAATGAPVIAGAPRVGLTLTADTAAIMDEDGLDDVSYGYQWVRVDEDGISNATPIEGETGSSYTLTFDDAGKRVRVRVSFTDDKSIPEERTSDAYPATGTVIDDTLVSSLLETTHSSRLGVGSKSGTEASQGFVTASHDGGYRFNGVSVVIGENNLTGSETATLKIYDSDSDGKPKDELYILTTPTLTAGATVFFAALWAQSSSRTRDTT